MSARERTIAVYGAYGHTGRFVVAELHKRGWTPILSGRDPVRLHAFATAYPSLDVRPASIDDPAALDRALAGTVAVLHCAGPFLDTAAPMIEAALRAGVHYLDLAAEQAAVLATFEKYSDRARDAGIVLLPAMAFYGGFADLLATAVMGDGARADEIGIAVALDSWLPTKGTRLTGERNTVPRVVVSGGVMAPLADSSPTRTWDFSEPFGTQEVVAVPLSEMITLSRHLHVPEIHAYMNLHPLKDLGDPATPAPVAADSSGRSAQTFLLDVVVREGDRTRRAEASGRDIYAVSAPLIVEAAVRIMRHPDRPGGAFAPGQIFDARDFLRALSPEHFTLAFTSGGAPDAES
ncbi:MAG TPA: saccharopine dehydrogenase NADP-binding domain-containing protein [Rhodanobacteraceae bacterium]|nr:saccharopine dehydrogenase NADP-binding domain-containing protein [Rhodanobacteraceae bacterium]